MTRATIGKVLQLREGEALGILKGCYRNLLNNLYWLAKADSVNPSHVQNHCIFEGIEHLQRAQAQGRGVVICAIHIGVWEKSSRIMPLVGFPCAYVATAQHNPLIDRELLKSRERGGNRVLHKTAGLRSALKLLKEGGRVALLNDIHGGERGIKADFLGISTSTPKTAADLAIRTNSVLIVGSTYQNPQNKTVLVFSQPFQPLSGEPDPMLSMIKWMNQEYSKLIKANPEQWFWLQRRFKEDLP